MGGMVERRCRMVPVLGRLRGPGAGQGRQFFSDIQRVVIAIASHLVDRSRGLRHDGLARRPNCETQSSSDRPTVERSIHDVYRTVIIGNTRSK